MAVNVAKDIVDGYHVYDFVCEGCGSEGLLKVPTDHQGQMPCPEGCGASYVQWLNTLQDRTELMCVIRPVFVGNEDDQRYVPE